ncbi:MAG: CBASS cGAMP-activated phospholipase [Burkholderiales bacterium]
MAVQELPRQLIARHAGEFRILALSGGGYLGLYSAAVLAALEARVGEPIGRRFDLVSGTSVGGILAAAVALEVPLTEIVELFHRHGAEVFSPRALPSGTIARLLDMSRSVLGPKYSGVELRDALAKRLGDRTLRDARHPLVLPAVNVTRGQTKIFKTPHAAASTGDEQVTMLDAAMATCAAPAYFPAVRVGGDLFADGGLFAVAPDQVALHEAEHFMGIDPARVRMLSIGTATAGYQPSGGVEEDAGAVGWLSGGRLILTLIAVQQQHVQAMLEDRLGERYLRLDAHWPEDAGLGIDVATPEAAKLLLALAEKTVRGLDAERLSAFL